MSKPKRRTMRRLKRTLGVTALILALLIAMIPSVGEANTYKSDDAGTITCELIYDSAELGNGLELTLEEFGGGLMNAVNSGDFRLTVTNVNIDNDIPWFANERFRYLFELTRFDEDSYRTDYKNNYGEPEGGAYDSSVLSKDTYYKPYSGIYMFTYKLTFTYNDLFSDTTTYYPSVYYYSQNDYSHDGSVPSETYVNGMTASPIASFTSNLTNIDHHSYVDVYINSDPQKDIYIDSAYDDRYGDSVYFASVNAQLQPYQADSLPMMPDAISVSDGLKRMYLPAHKVYLETTDLDENAYPNATSVGVYPNGDNVSGLGANDYGADKMEVIAAFDTNLLADLDGDGTAESSMSDDDKKNFGSHHMYISFPLDGSGLSTRKYSKFVRYSDKIRVMYQTISGGTNLWYDDYGAIDPSVGTGTETLVVPVTYISEITRMIVLIERAGAVFRTTDKREPKSVYQSIVNDNPPSLKDSSASLSSNLYVTIDDVPSGTTYDNYVADSGVTSQAHYNNENYIRDIEVLQVVTSTDSEQLYSDSSFDTYTLSVGLHEDLNVLLKTAEVHVYHYSISSGSWIQYDTAGRTGLFVDSGTNRASIRFEVSADDLNNDYSNPMGIYVIYYEASKGDLTGGSITGRDLRQTDGKTGYNSVNGVSASLDGTMTGGTYYLVVEDKTNNLIIDNDSEKDERISEYTDGEYYYNIYVGVPQGNSTRYYDDVSSSVSFYDGNGVNVSLTMPSAWTVTSTSNVLLVRAHTDHTTGDTDITWGYPYEVLSGNRIMFTSNAFSEYAVFYHDSSTTEEDDYSDLVVVQSNCYTADEDLDHRATAKTTRQLNGVEWDLVLTDPPRSDKDTNYLEFLVEDKYTTNDGTLYYPFYLELDEISAGAPVKITDIGSDKIYLYLPVPEETGYSSNDSVSIIGLNDGKDIDNRTKGSPFSLAGHDGKYMLLELDSNALANDNPYVLVYTPANGSSGGGGGGGSDDDDSSEAIEIDTYDMTDEDEAAALPAGTSTAVDLKALGKWSVKTTIPIEENMELELLVSQYTDPNNTSIGQSIINNNGITAWESGKSTIKAYDIKLKKTTNVGKSSETVTWPSTPEDLGKKTVTITLPYQANLSNPNGTVSVWTLDKSGSLENLLAATTATSGGTVTFTTEHFSQYALLYNPGTASSTGSTSTTGSSSSSSNSSSGRSSSSSSSSSGSSSSSSNSGSSGSNTGSTSSSSSGGGGNRAGGDSSVDMPRTADATTYKAIFILILLAFGAFELISSMPAKKKARAQGK